jgi:hypothetical protein
MRSAQGSPRARRASGVAIDDGKEWCTAQNKLQRVEADATGKEGASGAH